MIDTPAVKSIAGPARPAHGLARAGDRIIAVGQRGHVLWSDNAGQEWQQAQVPVSSDLVAVTFASPAKGWAVGHDGVILHTADGGKSWQRQRDGRPDAADVPLLDVWFRDERSGYARGAFGTLLETQDGGATRQSAQERTDNPEEDASLRGATGRRRPVDRGRARPPDEASDRASGRFVAVPLPYQGTLFGVTGTANAVVVHGLRGNELRSTDRGASWQAVPTGVQVGITASAVDAAGASCWPARPATSSSALTTAPASRRSPSSDPSPAAVLGAATGRVLVAGFARRANPAAALTPSSRDPPCMPPFDTDAALAASAENFDPASGSGLSGSCSTTAAWCWSCACCSRWCWAPSLPPG